MDEAYMRKMQGVNVVMAKELPNQIRDMLIEKVSRWPRQRQSWSERKTFWSLRLFRKDEL